MKKLVNIGIVAFFMVAFALVSCSKDDDEEENKLDDRLVGTKWSCEDPVRKAFYGGVWYQLYEFTSATKVEKYGTKNGVVDKVYGEYNYTLIYPDITINEVDSNGNPVEIKFRFVDSRTMQRLNDDGTLSEAFDYAKYLKQ